jgi:uridine phosphorylase
MSKYFPPSELIINSDGSAFHLHLKPEQLADRVILVGDPGRVDTIATLLDYVECEVSNREFHTVTGLFQGKRITVQSTGIGCDNIDIVMNELDSLANIDYSTRTEKSEHRTLQIVRIGTCGGLQPFTPLGTYLCSVKSIGFDGLLDFYAGRDQVSDLAFEAAFRKHMQWSYRHAAPYVVDSDAELLRRIMQDDNRMVAGCTISCGGFYGPQGRVLRVPLSDPAQNEKVESFSFEGHRITNFEMESSAVSGLAHLMGHKAMTVCMVIANRYAKEMNTDYKSLMNDLIIRVLERI